MTQTVHMLACSTNRLLTVLQLLQYHVVPGMALTVDTLTNGQTLTTALSGQTLEVSRPAIAVATF